MTERMPSRQTGERTGSRPSAAEGGGASRASLEAGRSPVYLSAQLLPGNRALLLPSPARSSRELDTSVGVPGPHAFTSASAPFARTKTSCASPTRPSQPRLTCRDDRDTPSASRRDGGDNHIFLENGSGIFSKRQNSQIGCASHCDYSPFWEDNALLGAPRRRASGAILPI